MSGCHDHSHLPKQQSFNQAFIIAISANAVFVLAQLIAAVFANSTSLLADAVHNLGDVLSLVLAGIANYLLQKKPCDKTTYGMKKTSIMASLANGMLLIFTCGIIASEAMYKFFSLSEVGTVTVMLMAGGGIVVNGATALLFLRGKHDLNIYAAFLHLVYDALISLGVVVSSALMYWTGWLWLDPLVGLLIALIILKGTRRLFSDSFRLLMDGVPREIVLGDVRALLQTHPGVQHVHDLHVWAMSTQENALSVHLSMPQNPLTDEARAALVSTLREKFNIHHATIQVEREEGYCYDSCVNYL